MNRSLVMTVIGPDRPGLVESIASVVSRAGGNWEESRMARLAGQFAGILRVLVPTDRASELVAALRGLSSRGIEVTVVEGSDPSAPPARTVRLDIVGHDRPGIVHHVSELLAARGINVGSLETRCESAPMSGEPLFHARADLEVVAGVSISDLRRDLERIAAELMVDVHVGEG